MSLLLISFASLLSTTLGGVLVLVLGDPNHFMIGSLEAFAAGIMVFVSVLDLVEESAFPWMLRSLFFLLGFFAFHVLALTLPEYQDDVQALLPSVAPSKAGSDSRSKALRLSMLIAVGVAAHNIPEGIVLYLMGSRPFGFVLMLSMCLHDIPEGMAIASPLYFAGVRKAYVIGVPFFAGACESLGTILASFVVSFYVPSPTFISSLTCMVSGIMIYLSLVELFPSAIPFCGVKYSLISFAFGFF